MKFLRNISLVGNTGHFDLAKRQLVQRLSDEILHVRSRLDDPPDSRGTDQNGRVTFLPKLFGTDAVQSPRVRV